MIVLVEKPQTQMGHATASAITFVVKTSEH